MKWMTVQEYADYEGISLAAAYKRIKEERAKSEKKFGKLVVFPKKKNKVV
jgi:hypothetical protein